MVDINPTLHHSIARERSGRLPSDYSPIPNFSPNNPYWRPKLPGFPLQYQKGPTLLDFLYASAWEMNRRFDVHRAYLVRQAMTRTVRINFTFGKLTYKEKAYEKVV